MPENRGNATAYVSGAGHIPLPRADQQTYRAAHQTQHPKPTSTFNWDWNKNPCTSCQTKTPKPQLVDGQCPTCRGVDAPRAQPARNPDRPRLEHSKDGDQVYVAYQERDLAERFTAPAVVPAEPEPEPVPAAAEPVAQIEPSSEVENREPPPRPTYPDLLTLQLEHTARTLTRAHGSTDPVVGMLRTAVLSSIAALDVYLEPHQHPRIPVASTAGPADATGQTTLPASPGQGEDRPAADSEGEADKQPARFQTFQKPPGRPRSQDTPELIADVVRRYRDNHESLTTIMAATHLGKHRIRRILTDAGTTIRPRAAEPRDLTPETEQAIVQAYLAGESSADVGSRYKIRATAVRDLARAAGHQIHGRGAATRANTERLSELGLTTRQVKDWAVEQGLLPAITRGAVASSIVNAYLAAHPDIQEGPA